MANPKVILGHYMAEYRWNITGDHVTWQASIIHDGAQVDTWVRRIHHPRGPEHITEEGVRAAVIDGLQQYAEESGSCEDEMSEFKDD